MIFKLELSSNKKDKRNIFLLSFLFELHFYFLTTGKTIIEAFLPPK